MRMFLIIGYLVKLAFYMPRLMLFWAYRILVFFTKPGAMLMLPVALIGTTFWFRETINFSMWANGLNAQFYGWLTQVLYEVTGTARSIRNLSPVMTAITVQVLAIPALYIAFMVLRPIIGTLPILSPPMFPQLWLPPREVKLKAYRATVAAPMLAGRAWDGNPRDLIERLPDDVRAVLECSAQAQTLPAPIIDAQMQPPPVDLPSEVEEAGNAFAGDDDIIRPDVMPSHS